MKNKNCLTNYPPRSSSTELLRIVACIMIITIHYIGKGTTLLSDFSDSNKINIYLSFCLESLGIGAVNIFMLITGYHGIESRGFSLRRVIDIILLSGFYGVICYTISVFSGYDNLSVTGVYTALFPEFFGKIWYVSVYLIFIFIIPVINPLLKSLSKKTFIILITIFLTVFSVIPFLFGEGRKGYDIYQYFLMYLIGAYIRLYPPKSNKKIYAIVFIVFSSITAIIRAYLGVDFKIGTHIFDYTSIFIIIASVAVFLFFTDLNFNSLFVNKIAKYTLGIYIMNVFCDMEAEKFYYKLISSEKAGNSSFFILYLIISVVGFFVVALFIDAFRNYLHNKLISPMLNKSELINCRIIGKKNNKNLYDA